MQYGLLVLQEVMIYEIYVAYSTDLRSYACQLQQYIELEKRTVGQFHGSEVSFYYMVMPFLHDISDPEKYLQFYKQTLMDQLSSRGFVLINKNRAMNVNQYQNLIPHIPVPWMNTNNYNHYSPTA